MNGKDSSTRITPSADIQTRTVQTTGVVLLAAKLGCALLWHCGWLRGRFVIMVLAAAVSITISIVTAALMISIVAILSGLNHLAAIVIPISAAMPMTTIVLREYGLDRE